MTRKKILFIGANSDIAIASLSLLKDHDVIGLSRSTSNETHFSAFHTYDPSNPEWPSIPELDALVYFPGSINLKPLTSLREKDFVSDFELNALNAVKAIQHYLPQLKAGHDSSVVLFSSVAVQTGMAFHASVAMAKGAVEGLTRSLASELAPKVRVNCIAPSLTETKLASRILRNEKQKEAAIDRHPLKKIGSPQDIAQIVKFLVSEESQWMTGQILSIDGGMSVLR